MNRWHCIPYAVSVWMALLVIGGAFPVSGQTVSRPTNPQVVQTQRERIRQLMAKRKAEIEAKRAEREALGEPAEEGQTPPDTPRTLPPGAAPGSLPRSAVAPPPVAEAPPAEESGPVITSRVFLTMDPQGTTTYVDRLFDSRVTARNEYRAPIDGVEIQLVWSPQVVELVAVSDASLTPYGRSAPIYECDPEKGRLYYKTTLAKPHHFNNAGLLQLRWKTRMPAVSSPIQFVTSADPSSPTTALRYRDLDQLGLETDPHDGVLHAMVSVTSPEWHTNRPILERALVSLDQGIRLTMDAPTTQPLHVGDVTTVTVRLENPSRQFMDSLRVRIWFDPNVLEVMDQDRRNWIRRGINVWDGPARERYPFQFLGTNEVNNKRGQIDYWMGMGERFIPSDGDLFHIIFKAKAPIADNVLCLDVTADDRPGSEPHTAIYADGRNVTDYGIMLDRYDVFHDMPIYPARAGESGAAPPAGAPVG